MQKSDRRHLSWLALKGHLTFQHGQEDPKSCRDASLNPTVRKRHGDLNQGHSTASLACPDKSQSHEKQRQTRAPCRYRALEA